MPAIASGRTVLAFVLLAVALSFCQRLDEQIIGHVAKAELIERYGVSEDEIHIVQIRVEDSASATVRAEIRRGGRTGERQTVTCALARAPRSATGEVRWAVISTEEESPSER